MYPFPLAVVQMNIQVLWSAYRTLSGLQIGYGRHKYNILVNPGVKFVTKMSNKMLPLDSRGCKYKLIIISTTDVYYLNSVALGLT